MVFLLNLLIPLYTHIHYKLHNILNNNFANKNKVEDNNSLNNNWIDYINRTIGKFFAKKDFDNVEDVLVRKSKD